MTRAGYVENRSSKSSTAKPWADARRASCHHSAQVEPLPQGRLSKVAVDRLHRIDLGIVEHVAENNEIGAPRKPLCRRTAASSRIPWLLVRTQIPSHFSCRFCTISYSRPGTADRRCSRLANGSCEPRIGACMARVGWSHDRATSAPPSIRSINRTTRASYIPGPSPFEDLDIELSTSKEVGTAIARAPSPHRKRFPIRLEVNRGVLFSARP